MNIENCVHGINLTVISAVAAIDDSTGHTSSAFNVASPAGPHYHNFLLWISALPSGTTDALTWELYPGRDGTVYSDLVVGTGSIALINPAATENHVFSITAFPYWDAKLKVFSAGATDTWTVTAIIQPWKLTELTKRG